MASSCPAISNPNSMWNFCPNIDAAYALTVFFGLSTIAHLVQAIYYKTPYCWVIVMSGVAQTVNYIARILSIQNPASFGAYAAWFVLILIAPLFTNAFVYMVMGRMVWNFIPSAKIYRVTAWRFGMYFVMLDFIALIIQVCGAAMASTGVHQTEAETLRSLHIYMIGVGVQQGFILLFCVFAVRFHYLVITEARVNASYNSGRALMLLYAVYAVLVLITMRIVFRLCEYAQGLTSNIPNHEAYQYCLDTLPMLLALVLLNVVHPSRIMPGEDSKMPGRKDRRAGLHIKSDRERILDEHEMLGRA